VVAADYQPPPAGVALVRVRLAGALWVLGRLEEARREVTRAEALLRAGRDTTTDLGNALAVSGAIHLSAARYPEARADFSRSFRLLESSGAVAPLLGLGVTELRDGQPGRAVAPLERAHRRAPLGADGALVTAFLGRALLESGRDRARGRALLVEARPLLAPHGRITLASYPAAIADELDRYYATHSELR
jgi:tetratricopeptide (TPR) repeat protein